MATRTYSSIDLAVEQLDSAIALFLERERFVSSLTLAGAAEELFGETLSNANQQNTLEWRYAMIEPTRALLERTTLSKRDFITLENRARDAAKHLRPGGIHLDVEDEALWMIVRASDNARRLGLPPSNNTSAFDDWFYEHVVGY
jgi:hypothetical protein